MLVLIHFFSSRCPPCRCLEGRSRSLGSRARKEIGLAVAARMRRPLPLRKWAIAIYQMTTSLKSVSSMKLHRDIGITQSSAWHMLHRIREAMDSGDTLFSGPVEVDEIYLSIERMRA